MAIVVFFDKTGSRTLASSPTSVSVRAALGVPGEYRGETVKAFVALK
jgi:acyl-CoA synthetase (AMP-forming)/AMP-acid ligase II